AVDDLEAVHREEEWVADGLDVLQSPEFLLSPGAILVESIVATGDELDRLVQTARRFALPNLPKTAFPERFEKAITRDRFRIGRFERLHPRNPGAGGHDSVGRRPHRHPLRERSAWRVEPALNHPRRRLVGSARSLNNPSSRLGHKGCAAAPISE